MKILIIGASGMLGKPVTRELIRSGFDCSLLARDPDKMKAIFPEADIIQGDVLDPESLNKAMTDMDAVYCNLSVSQDSREKDAQPEREGIDNIILSARQNRIKRLACISSLVHRYEGMNGFHWWAFSIKAAAVQKIKSSGIPYTLFYPSTFMETFPYQMIRGNKIANLGTSVAPMWFIAAEDYALQVAASFRLLTNESREYSIQGPEAFTFETANRVFAAHYTKQKLGIMKAPIWLAKILGVFKQSFHYGWHICEALNKYPEQFESDQSWKELGKPAITLAEYAASLK